MKIGVLGGTFDPVHLGHINIAQTAKTKLDLHEVIFMPAGQPVFKLDLPVTLAEHRLKMLRLAVKGLPGIRVSTIELERTGPTYTVDTLEILKSKLDAGTEIYFIVGWDSLAQLPAWREPDRVISLCSLAAVPRPGFDKPDIRDLEKQIPGISKRVVFLDGPHIDISATIIRRAIAQEKPITHLVPEAVAAYILKHKLYINQE
jgi:nicotinate-nucleotide adenylyltransferase